MQGMQGMQMGQQMQMLSGLSPQAAMTMAQGMSMGVGKMGPPGMPFGASLPGMGMGMRVVGMAGAPGLGVGSKGKYSMVAPPANLVNEHNKLMHDNEVDGKGLELVADAPQQNRHGADYFQRDAPDAAYGGRRRLRDDDDDYDRGRGVRHGTPLCVCWCRLARMHTAQGLWRACGRGRYIGLLKFRKAHA